MNIRFSGLSLARDEQAVQNGELAVCAGVELHDGAIRPSVITGSERRRLKNGAYTYKLMYVHDTSNYRHYIAVNPVNNEMYWFDDEDSTQQNSVHGFTSEVSVSSVSSIGNTLIIVASDGVHYALWKDADYKYLGTKPPFLDIAFSVSDNKSGQYEMGGVDWENESNEYKVAIQQTNLSCADAVSGVDESTTFLPGTRAFSVKGEKQADITENLWALVNRTNNYIARQGHFFANFFVRYCYRLYDGTMFMHSAPVFIPVLTPDNYKVYLVNAAVNATTKKNFSLSDSLNVKVENTDGTTATINISKLTLLYHPHNVALTYKVMNHNTNDATILALENWSDIIKSLDIFVSAPVVSAQPGRLVSSGSFLTEDFALGEIEPWEYIGTNTDGTQIHPFTFDIPSLTASAYTDKIISTAEFFRVSSMPVEELSTMSAFEELSLDSSITAELENVSEEDNGSLLENVTTGELMKDDYKSHNFLFANGQYVYNKRLNLITDHEQLFRGFQPHQLWPTGFLGEESSIKVTDIVVQLNTDNGKKYVKVTSLTGSQYREFSPKLVHFSPKFYPDPRAEKMYIYFSITSGGTTTNHVNMYTMRECPRLNGAFTEQVIKGDGNNIVTEATLTYTVDDIVSLQSKIYTSEVNNPFYFPVEGINAVGVGKLYGLASTTRALSQGQFGQYPLMAFASDGIWALNVASNGTYSSIHPISREVCANPDSITQLDQSVVFATDRALNKIVESAVISLSDILDGPFFNVLQALPQLSTEFQDNDGVLQLLQFNTPAVEYFKDGKIVYDFVNQRLLAAPSRTTPGQPTVIMVYSIRDNAWSTTIVNAPLAVINSYPYPYVQLADGTVVILDQKYSYDDNTCYEGIILTRTLSFQGVMNAVIGFSQETDCIPLPRIFLFGSNDNINWSYIGSAQRREMDYLPAKAFRFFRLAIHFKMTQAEKYFSTNLKIIEKYAKQ